jgi:cysteinyl-tRNA synthetase
MAKSVGNIFLLREVLDRYTPPVLLTYFLTTHYRSPLEFSVEKLEEAKAAYARLTGALTDIEFRLDYADRAARQGVHQELGDRVERARRSFAEAMDDDLNTAAAMGELFAVVAGVYRYLADVDRGVVVLDSAALRAAHEFLVESLSVLLIALPERAAGKAATGAVAGEAAEQCSTGVMALAAAPELAASGRWDDIALVYADRLQCGDATYACVLRDHFRAEKLWGEADRLRDEMHAAGLEVRDTPQGTQVVRQS